MSTVPHNFTLTPAVNKSSSSPHPHYQLLSLVFLKTAIPAGVKQNLRILICILLIAKDVKQFFRYLLVIYILNNFIQFISSCIVDCGIYFLCLVLVVLYIFQMLTLCLILSWQIFFSSLGCLSLWRLFHFLCKDSVVCNPICQLWGDYFLCYKKMSFSYMILNTSSTNSKESSPFPFNSFI